MMCVAWPTEDKLHLSVWLFRIALINHSCTVVIKAVCDLMPNNHSYSTKVKGLVLVFAEERWLQDSCWKHLIDKNNRSENTTSKQDYNEVCQKTYIL